MLADIQRAADNALAMHNGPTVDYVVVGRVHAVAVPTTSVGSPAVVSTPTVSEPEPVASGGVSSLDELIARVARDAASRVVADALASFDPMDTDKVIDLVRSTVNDLVSRPQVTNVTVNGCPTVSFTNRVHKQFEDVLKHIVAGDELYLHGGAGAGKTTTVRQIAVDVLRRRFELVTFSSQTTEAKLVGFRDASGEVRETPLVSALREGGVVLFDEFDACPPAIAVVLNTMSANRVVSTPAGTFDLHKDTVLVFSGNTVLDGANSAYSGRQASDFSTKDRLSVLEFQYDLDMEYDLTVSALDGDHAMANRWLEVVRACRANAKALGGTTGARIAVTPRAAIGGAKLLKAGFGIQYVADVRIRKGMDAQTWDQVRNNVPALA
jgi:cobaltochelatase CobS